MRIGLFTEGTYPVVTGGVSTWCEHLINGMPEHTFVPVTLIGGEERARGGLPPNVADVTLIPMWGRVRPSLTLVDARDEARLDDILARLWATVLPSDGRAGDLAGYRACLQELVGWRGYRLASLLTARGSTRWILAAWTAHRAARPDLPPMTLGDAAAVAAMCDRVLALADRDWPEVDVSHVASNGPPSLLALGRWWTRQTPIVVTEHGIYLRERFLALGESDTSWPTRYTIGAFLRMLTQLTYAEAVAIAPVSDFNRRWELRLGADPARTATIYNGVDTGKYALITTEPDVPTVTFVGRIDPLKGLEVLVDAFARVVRRIPDARLRLYGPTPPVNAAYRAGLERQITELGLADRVTFEGSVDTSTIGFAAGHVVALSSISEGLPYGVIEALMCGRPTVNTDVGGVSEVVGRDGTCGRVVPPRDPDAFADALCDYLLDPELRARTRVSARDRGLRLFDMDTFVASYRSLYDTAAASGRPPAGRAVGRRAIQ